MAEEENRSGLLSKVAKFVRNPTKDWSELDQKEPEAEGGYSKEALKEMIERKRQNDFVRKREFDHLRKLRRRDPLGPPDQAGRPSFFQSSMTSNHDDRAETLKKIDEIEAQMSRQWWKGKEAASRAGAFPMGPGAGLKPEAGPTQPPTTVPSEPDAAATSGGEDSHFQPTEASGLRPGSSQWGEPEGGGEYIPTQLADASPTVPASMALRQGLAASASRPISRPQSLPPQGGPRMPVGAGFSTQRLYAQVPVDNLTDPDLEDAAIRFANGDDAGAEESLLAALASGEQRPELTETWMSALFDLYRATGQQARFDSVALEFANRYGRSAPAWFSMPDMLGRSKSVAPVKARPSTSVASPADWSSPAQLDAAALQELQALMRVPGPLVLDWQAVGAIAPDAVPLLSQMVAHWCVSPALLVFRGHASLERALLALTPSGDRSVDPVCWQLRMDALRIMRLQDAFELVALDYCVTYEVSPPSWQEPRCSCDLQGLNDPAEAEAEDIRSRWDEPHSMWDDPLRNLTVPAGLEEQPPAVVELYGEIIGDAAEVLAKLEKGMEGSTRMVVSCARLIRVDFSAAGSILNWVAEQQGQGCQVQFRDVNRMVAAFFNVIGISEHARVVPRAA
ncbi:MAG: STAS domain-containing protein [Burkholderiaceae bacterium]|uniref:STAS domain-containing protein n=1 Tax=Hylemonella sp. TaxID=2066020 RepID=UPI0035AF895A|nr:STAS domain-containing protein [Burkholderiaceae bacterium]